MVERRDNMKVKKCMCVWQLERSWRVNEGNGMSDRNERQQERGRLDRRLVSKYLKTQEFLLYEFCPLDTSLIWTHLLLSPVWCIFVYHPISLARLRFRLSWASILHLHLTLILSPSLLLYVAHQVRYFVCVPSLSSPFLHLRYILSLHLEKSQRMKWTKERSEWGNVMRWWMRGDTICEWHEGMRERSEREQEVERYMWEERRCWWVIEGEQQRQESNETNRWTTKKRL